MTTYDEVVGYDAAIPYDGVTTDRTPGLHLVFEVAFATDPDDPAPVWVDLTSRLDLQAGVTITRGREDEYSVIQPGRMTVTLDNVDGALTPGNASSPYFPNVLPQRRCRLAYVDPATSSRRYRFDGYIDEWPVEWPGGSGNYSSSVITATDMLSRIGARQKLRSVVVETMALDHPSYHFPLSEPRDSTTVTDIASSEPAVLTVAQIGTGGTIEFGDATGVPTDGESAPTFVRVDGSNGKCLDGALPVPIPGGGPVVIEAAFNTTQSNACIAVLYDNWGNYLRLAVSGGVLSGERGNAGNSLTAIQAGYPGAVNDGETHHATLTMTASGGTVTLALSRDGLTAGTDGTGSTADWPMVEWTRLAVGANKPLGLLAWDGAISHVALYGATLSSARKLEHRLAQSTGFAGERSDQRIARICTWIGLPTSRQDLDTGTSTNIGHLDCTGMSPLEYMRKIEATEAGMLWTSADGMLTFHNRARSYGTAAPTVSLPSRILDGGVRLAENLLLVKNIVTGSRSGGATVRMTDQDSVDAYGPLSEDLDVVVGTDALVADAVAWRLNTGKVPRPRFTNLDIDAYTDGVYSPLIIDDLIIDGRVEVTGMPAQAPSSTMRQTVQGYTETITHSRWSLSVNATPYEHMVALILDDATFGQLDSTNVLAY